MATAYCIPFPTETDAVLEKFSNYLYARRGMADSTVALTVGFIRRMMPVTGPHPSPEAIEAYIASMRRRGMSYGNVSNAIKAVERYSDFLGVSVHLGRPRRPQPVPVTILSEAKIAIMIAATKNIREKALVSLLAYSGIRNNELVNLRICDIDIPQQSVTVECGKGAKGRICCITGDCGEILNEYLRWRVGREDDWLFVTARHRHKMQTQDVRKMVRVVAKRAGVNRRVFPHLFRHSLATALIDRGARAHSIQALLGHAYLSTTFQYYLHPNVRNTRADYYRCVPSFV